MSSLTDFIATDHPFPGIQRLRAGFFGHAYDPHRHESYAIGVTERGLQAFRYRGIDCVSTTGWTIVLHPDELHDGHAAAPEGFVYRMLYINATLVADALEEGAALPFVPDPVGDDPVLAAALIEAFEGFPESSAMLAGAAIVAEVADCLCRRAGRRATPRPAQYYGPRLNQARSARCGGGSFGHGGRPRSRHRHRPLPARPRLSCPLRDLAAPLPDRPSAAACQGSDRHGSTARRGRSRRRLRRPEPHDAAFQGALRPHSRPLRPAAAASRSALHRLRRFACRRGSAGGP